MLGGSVEQGLQEDCRARIGGQTGRFGGIFFHPNVKSTSMHMPPTSIVDKEGVLISVGANATIPTIPNWLVSDLPADDVIALRKLEGTVMPIVDIDDHGYVWFGANGQSCRWFCLRPDEITLVKA